MKKITQRILVLVVAVICLGGVTLVAGAMGWSDTASVALRFLSASEEKRNFFANDGIRVEEPIPTGENKYQVPIELETAIAHSAWGVDSVKVSVADGRIEMTARYALVGREMFPGYLEIEGVEPGDYELQYRDPDGSLHPVGEVTFP